MPFHICLAYPISWFPTIQLKFVWWCFKSFNFCGQVSVDGTYQIVTELFWAELFWAEKCCLFVSNVRRSYKCKNPTWKQWNVPTLKELNSRGMHSSNCIQLVTSTEMVVSNLDKTIHKTINLTCCGLNYWIQHTWTRVNDWICVTDTTNNDLF